MNISYKISFWKIEQKINTHHPDRVTYKMYNNTNIS